MIERQHSGHPRPEVTEGKKKAYLAALVEVGGIIGKACEAADVPRSTLTHWRQDDSEFDDGRTFAEVEQIMIDAASEELEVEARRRAILGVREPVFHQGKLQYEVDPLTGSYKLDDDFNPIPLTVLKYSDRLLEICLKAKRPNFRDKVALEHSGPGGGPIPNKLTVVFVNSDGDGHPAPGSEFDQEGNPIKKKDVDPLDA